jgi:hypothetical protein
MASQVGGWWPVQLTWEGLLALACLPEVPAMINDARVLIIVAIVATEAMLGHYQHVLVKPTIFKQQTESMQQT